VPQAKELGKMAAYKIFAQRIGLIGITNILLSLSGIILLPIITKNISIKEYGIWAQIMVTISLAPDVILLGLPYSMIRFLPSAKKEDIREIFYSIFLMVSFTSLISSLIICLLLETIEVSILNDSLIIAVSSIIFIECINNFFMNYFKATQQIKKYSALLFTNTCLFIIFVSIFILQGKGLLGAVIGLGMKSVILFLIMAIIIISEIGIGLPKFKYLDEYLSFGLPTVAGNISNWVVNSSDRYVIGMFLGPSFVGYYSPGYTLGNMVGMFISPISFILSAVLSKYYDNNNLTEVKTILSYSLKYYLSIAIPSTFGISLLSKTLLTIISTPEIASYGYLITPFTAISYLFYGACLIIQQPIIMGKKTKITGKILTISAVINLILNFVLVPYMGIIGAAITTLLAFTLSLILTFYYSLKFFKFHIDIAFILKSILASIVMCIILIKLNPTSLFSIEEIHFFKNLV
jgi:O-antigen/teichoic acid export membrane protein